jgi:type VI secretion system protein ImpH
MGSADGGESAGLSRELLEEAYRFEFFQAVRLLEHARREREGRSREAGFEGHGVGRDTRPASEAVRFRALPSLSFPAGAVNEVRIARTRTGGREESHSPEMLVNFLGLTGPNGVLPRHYTETLLQRIRDKDDSLRDFLDLFNHRLISLFYRAWEKYCLPVTYERSQLDDPGGDPDPVTRGIFGFDGLGTNGLRNRLEVHDEVFLHYSGHFAHFPRSAIALECLLADHLEMPVAVLQCQGQWLKLELDDQATMPSRAEPNGRNNRLGVNLVVGDRVWDVQSKFRLRLGPLSWLQFRSLMPNGRALRPLCQMTRFYAGPTLDFDIQPTLIPREVPPCELTGDPDNGPYLGWNAWMPRLSPPPDCLDDAVFQIETI